MVAINTTPSEEGQLAAWRDKGKYTFPIVLSRGGGFVKTTYGVLMTPTNVLLNSDGREAFRNLGGGAGAASIVEAEIRELLGLKPFEGLEPDFPTTPNPLR
jgi:hypothetical protein